MKSRIILFLLGLFICVTSCSSDDECTAEDWIGTYSLDAGSEDCPDENVSLSEQIVITAGSDNSTVVFEGITVDATSCDVEATDPFFGLTVTASLDGDKLTVSGFGCTGTYTRQ